MNIQYIVNSSISDIRNNISTNGIMYYIIQEMMNKVKLSNVVSQTNKRSFIDYLARLGKPNNSINPVQIGDVAKTSPQNLLILTIIYYLSDLNKYDFQIINYALNYNLSIEEILVLLLINDIQTLNLFFKSKNISGNQQYTLSTLKKLSALQRIEWNY